MLAASCKLGLENVSGVNVFVNFTLTVFKLHLRSLHLVWEIGSLAFCLSKDNHYAVSKTCKIVQFNLICWKTNDGKYNWRAKLGWVDDYITSIISNWIYQKLVANQKRQFIS